MCPGTSPPNHFNPSHLTTMARSGSVYQLGEPRPEYAAKFPNAKQRLLDSIPEK